MSVTIREVARAAGVSATTVSRVFNQEHLVSVNTRTRVLSIAKRLHYVPNAAARSLSARRTHVLGVLVPLPHAEFFMEMVRGMDEAALQHGYLLVISGSHNRIADMRTAFRAMKGQVDGFLVVAPNVARELLQDALQDVLPSETPAVFLNSSAPGGRHRAVRLANHDGAYQAVQHLLALGHERIALVAGPEINGETHERRAGYLQALRDAGLAPDPALQVQGAFTRESGVEAGRALLAMDPRPTAVFASNDLMAIGLLSIFHAAGVRVPEEIALIGFDDIPMARYVQPTLSTVHVPIREMGARAVERLVERLDEGSDAEVTTDMMETTLRLRASTLGSDYREEPLYSYLS